MRKVTGEARKPKTMGKENIWITDEDRTVWILDDGEIKVRKA